MSGIAFKHHAEFDPCPTYEGEAVCVDVTPLQTRPSDYGSGSRDVFQVVFEVDLERDKAPADQSPRYVVWSKSFTPSLHKKADFPKFINSWFGKTMTEDDWKEFNSEDLIGRPAMLWVEQKEVGEDKVYSNIVMIRPSKKPIKPSGKFTRKQDRDDKDDKGGKGGGDRRGASFKGTSGGKDEKKADHIPTEEEIAETPGIVRVHIGGFKGQELRDLDREEIETLIERWLERDLPKQDSVSAADKRLRQALKIYKKRFAKADEEAKSSKSRKSDNDGEGDPEDGEPVGAGKELDY